MTNTRIDLNGAWDFLHSDERAVTPARVRTIQTPSPWQAQFDDLRMRGGIGLYTRRFEIPADWLDGSMRIYLRFGAVFHICRVFINDAMAGAHEGGFLPFSFDVTDHLRAGENVIVVRVESPTDDPEEFPDAPLAELPFGKQSWYGPLSGIWQPVMLERRRAEHVQRTRIVAELESGRVRLRIMFVQPLLDHMDIHCDVVDPQGRVCARARDHAHPGALEAGADATVPAVQAWSPDAPNLYTVRIALKRKGQIVDSYEEAFGFRTIGTRNGRIILNGEPIYLRGALDQDYYPDTICTPPSMAFIEDQFRKAKELGLNCVRCHIKAADPRYYQAADRLGLLVWTELPNGGLSTERSRALKEATLQGIVDRDCNHPSIVIWTIINENWGVDLVHDPDHRAWLKRTYAWLKSYDPTRLVVDNSPLAPSFHVQTDLADFHHYAAFPDSRREWDRFVESLANREAFLFSPEGDAVQTGEEPLLCSEFGNWGLPHPRDIMNPDGSEPWWFETGHDWGEGIMYPHGVENRFRDWSMDRVFGSFDAFVEAAQWQQFQALKYEIEEMRRRQPIAGYVITELTDCHWESNGLLDMRRNTRVFHDVFKTINADTVIAPKWRRLSYWSGEPLEIDVSVAHGAGQALEGATLVVQHGQERERALPAIAAGDVLSLGRVAATAPTVSEPRFAKLRFEVRDGSGVVAANEVEYAVHPPRSGAPEAVGAIWSPDPDIAARFSELGYAVTPERAEAALMVAREATREMADAVRQGGRLLLVPEKEISLNPFFPHWQNVRVQSRDGALWRGDWASSFAWLRRGAVFGHIPGGPLLDATFDRVIPRHVISGCNLLDFQGRVFAGLVVGWVHKAVALVVERAYGRGHLVVSTLRLFEDAPGADPTATALLDAMARLAAGPVRHRHGMPAAEAGGGQAL